MVNLLMYGNRHGTLDASGEYSVYEATLTDTHSPPETTPWGTKYKCSGFSMFLLSELAGSITEECQKFAIAIFGPDASEEQKGTLLQSALMQPIQDARMGGYSSPTSVPSASPNAGGADLYGRPAAAYPVWPSNGQAEMYGAYAAAAVAGQDTAQTRMMMAQPPAANPYMLMDGGAYGPMAAWTSPRSILRTELHVAIPKILAHYHDEVWAKLAERKPAEGVSVTTDKVVIGYEPLTSAPEMSR
eukprot:Blabericola_migrator_1__4471@NODE_238_length_10988_cov_97_569087_g202_i0_p5_GENE_NODE_238_length_10988_cov_97_569087_g202_i0NODE_238_length_10988_cov_97_569087_g202_i0_p5_ORF_typecomplete_len244_score43_48_NODE_238_length_10988_cov_97_569087_g202_i056866417